MQEKERKLTHSIRDIIAIGGVLALLNWLLARTDMGWMTLNPTPWLLLPVLIGVRYGIAPGLVSGFCAAIGIVLAQARATGTTPHEFTQQHPYFFTSLLLAGFLAGEIHRSGHVRLLTLLVTNEQLAGRTGLLEAELELARETRQQLQRHLALLNAGIAGLDDDLRKLMSAPADQFMEGLLALLQQHGGLTSAAIYRQDGTKLHRLAALQPTLPLATFLHLDETPLAAKALDELAIAAVAKPLETTSAQPFLAALPWRGTEGQGVLLVQDMPLQAFDWPHLATAELIMNWAFTLSRYRSDLKDTANGQRSLETNEFVALLAQALDTEKMHHLPSVVLRVDFPKSKPAASAKVHQQLLKTLPSTALSTLLPDKNRLLVLLPFGGETEARALGAELAQTGTPLRVSHYLVTGSAPAEDFWAHVSVADAVLTPPA